MRLHPNEPYPHHTPGRGNKTQASQQHRCRLQQLEVFFWFPPLTKS